MANPKGSVYKTNPTIRQKRAAKIMAQSLIENTHKSAKEVLLEAGYDESTAVHPTLVTETKGYKMELAKYGLTEAFITSALVEDIKEKPQKRLGELQLGADILGMRKRTEEPKTTVEIALFSPEQQARIAARIISR